MLYFAQNLKRYRTIKNLTQEDVADYLGITPQSVSKWERGECYPDITLLPALANIFETSIDLLLGMDVIRAKEARYIIHKTAHEFMRNGANEEAEQVYRDALLVYPNKPDMILGLGEALALQGKAEDAVTLMEKGLSLSENEKQKATIRAALCFLYLQCGQADKANALASELPHRRECREEIQPQIQSGISAEEIERKIHHILLGESEKTW